MDKIYFKIKGLKELILIIIIAGALTAPAWFSGGNNPYAKEIIQALLIIASLLYLLFPGRKDNRANNNILFLLPALLSAMLLASLFSRAIYGSASYWIELFCYGLIFYIIVKTEFAEQKIELILKIFLASAVILSFAGLYFYISGNYARLTATFYWPNPFAGFLLFALPLAVHFLLAERKKTIWILALAVVSAAFIMTGSRGALISFAIAGAIYAVFFRKEIIKNRYQLMAALILTFAVVAFFSSSRPAGFFGRSKLNQASALDASSSIKLDYWRASLKIFKDNIFLGAGPAAWQTIYPLYQENPISSGKYPHNWVLEFLAEAGLVAAALFAAFIFLVFSRALKNSRGDSLKMAILAGVFGSVVHNLADIDWHFSANFLAFWILAGFLLSSAKNGPASGEKKQLAKTARVFAFIFLTALLLKNAIFIRSYYYQKKGLAAQGQNRLESAAADYKKSLFLNPNPDYLRKYGIMLFALGDFENAGAIAEKLKKNDRNNSLNYELAGKIFLAEDKLKEAEAEFRQAIRLDRFNYPRFYGELAALLIQSGRDAQAKNLLLDILKLFPENVIENRKIIIMPNQSLTSGIEKDLSNWYYLLGLISFRENNSELALKYSASALSLNPDNGPARNLINSIGR